MQSPAQNTTEEIEIGLLLEALRRHSGHDFRHYARASIGRRIRQYVAEQKLAHISELLPLCLHDERVLSDLVHAFSIPVTEMFRDPFVYRALRAQVVPFLKSHPFVKVWSAGCATGEEVYSTAIVLSEAGLSARSTLFGTDYNDEVLEQAKTGIYPLERMQEYTRNYQESGGTESFSNYYLAQYDAASMNAPLRKTITFANHNLTTDGVFGEMHLIMCRNVLIYFDAELQNRALRLFTDSLQRGGFLCLGSKETLRFSDVADAYEVVDDKAKLYKKKAVP